MEKEPLYGAPRMTTLKTEYVWTWLDKPKGIVRIDIKETTNLGTFLEKVAVLSRDDIDTFRNLFNEIEADA